jgi:hypothetical protein
MLEPSTIEGRQAHEELQALLECATVQQAKSSASQQHGPEIDQPTPSVAREKEASIHLEQQKARNKPSSIHACIGHNYDARNVLNARKRHKEDGAIRGYHPRHGGRYDSGEDQSPSPEPPGPRVFSQDIHNASFPGVTLTTYQCHQVLWGDKP